MKRLVVGSLIAALAGPALAQDAPGGTTEDWTLDRRSRNLLAYITLDNGLSLGARCRKGSYNVVIAGLPPSPAGAETRLLKVAFGEGDLRDETWNVTTDPTVAIASFPAPFARSLRHGGRLRVLVPGGATEGRNLLYDLELPASASAIDETLTACDRPLIDAADAGMEDIKPTGLPEHVTWRDRPRPRYPLGASYAWGYVVVTCLNNPDGTLRNCQIEASQPEDGYFDDVALRGVRDARIASDIEPDGQMRTRRIGFRITFRMR